MNNPNESLHVRATRAGFYKRYKEAIDLYTQAISSIRDADVGVGDGNIDADKTMSQLYSERASCFFSNERYTNALMDSETAIRLDTNNPFGHIQKIQSLIHLNRINEAQKAIEIAKTVGHDDATLLDLENSIQNTWFTTGNKVKKFVVTLAFTIATGLITNLMGGMSGWKQAIVVVIACLICSFIHLRRLFCFCTDRSYVLWHCITELAYRIWHSRRHNRVTNESSRNSVTENTENNQDSQSNTDRF